MKEKMKARWFHRLAFGILMIIVMNLIFVSLGTKATDWGVIWQLPFYILGFTILPNWYSGARGTGKIIEEPPEKDYEREGDCTSCPANRKIGNAVCPKCGNLLHARGE